MQKILYDPCTEQLVEKKSFFGWSLKDTNDTRESAAIYVADELIDEQAIIKFMTQKLLLSKFNLI